LNTALKLCEPAKYIVEKTPSHLFKVQRAKKLLPKVRIVFVKRNFFDIIWSMIQKNEFWNDSPQNIAQAVSLVNKYTAAIRKYDCTISYEALWFTPEREIEQLLMWLDLRRGQIIIDFIIA